MPGVNQVDVAAAALVLAFAYKGYRTGLIGVVLGLTGSLIAFALAAVLAPLLAPALMPVAHDLARVPAYLVQSALMVALTVALRLALGLAVRELVGVLRMLVRGVPPLVLIDRLLGIVPMAALGALLALALVLVAMNLPADLGTREAAADSWLARAVIAHPQEAYANLRDLADRLLTDPPRVNGLVLAAGTAGLAVAVVASWPLRASARASAFHEAPTVRIPRARLAEAELSDPLAWLRAMMGVGVALALAAALLLFIGLRAP
jgi:hypothetical protein